VLGWLLVVFCDSTDVGGAERSQRRVRGVTGSASSEQLMTSGLAYQREDTQGDPAALSRSGGEWLMCSALMRLITCLN
jgi:hypothetical protein